MDRCTVPQDRHLSVHLQSNLMQKITNQVTRHVLVGMQPKEHLCSESVALTEPECDCTDSRDLSPVATDWRNGRIGAFFGPPLSRDWDVAVRRLVDTENRLAISQLFLSCSASSLSQRSFSSGSFSAAPSLGLTGR